MQSREMYGQSGYPPLPAEVHEAFDNLYQKVFRTLQDSDNRGSEQLHFLNMQLSKLEQLVNNTIGQGAADDQRRDPGRHAPSGPHPNPLGPQGQGPPPPPPGFEQGARGMFPGMPGGPPGPPAGHKLAAPDSQQGVMPPHLSHQRPPPTGPGMVDGRPFPPGGPGMPTNGPQNIPSPAPHDPRGPLGDPRAPPPQSHPPPQSRYPGSPHVPQALPPVPVPVNDRYGNPPAAPNLTDLDFDTLDPDFKADGPDWYAVFNPTLPRTCDIELVHSLDHATVVCCVRFSLDGKFVATGCNWSAHIYDVITGQSVAELKDVNASGDGDLYIRSVCFSPDSTQLATGAEDKIIRVWNIKDRIVSREFGGHEQDIYSLDYSHDGKIIASGSGDRTVRLWDVVKGDMLLVLPIDDGVTTVAISPDSLFVAAGSLDKTVRVWDIETGKREHRLDGEEGHKDSVYSVAFSPDGSHLVSGSLDKTIKMWDLTREGSNIKAATCTRTFVGHKDFVLSVALTPNGNLIMSGSKDRGVQFWDPRTGNSILMLQGHKNSVISVAPSPSSDLFATGSGDMRARIWRLKRLLP